MPSAVWGCQRRFLRGRDALSHVLKDEYKFAWVLEGRRIQQDGKNLWSIGKGGVLEKQIANASMHCTKDEKGRR